MNTYVTWLKTNLTVILLVIAGAFLVTTCRARDTAIAQNAIYKVRIAAIDSTIKADQVLAKADSVSRDSVIKAADKRVSDAEKKANGSVFTVTLPDTVHIQVPVSDTVAKDSIKVDSIMIQVVPLSELKLVETSCKTTIDELKRVDLTEINGLKKEITDKTDREKIQDGHIEELQKQQKWVVAKGIIVGVAILKAVELLLPVKK